MRIVALHENEVIAKEDLSDLGSGLQMSSLAPQEETLRSKTTDYERKLIQDTLEKTAGNVTKAASLLKLTRQGLQYKMKRYGL